MTPAEQVAAAVNHPLLDPHKTLRLVTTAGRVFAWMREGADMDLIVATISGVMRTRKDASPVRAWGFFDEPIRRAIADKIEAEKFDAERRTGPSAQRAKRARAAESVLAELSELDAEPRAASG